MPRILNVVSDRGRAKGRCRTGTSLFVLGIVALASCLTRATATEVSSNIPSAPNLAKNSGFEEAGQDFAAHWGQVGEDTTVPWRQKLYARPDVGIYAPAVRERGNAHTGAYSIRCAAAVGQFSGVTQRIYLNQDKNRAVQLGVWCKTENVIPSSWCDLSLVNIRYTDDTFHETSWKAPFLSLGDKAHDWEYRFRLFEPAKPIRYVDVRVSLQGHMGEIDYTMPLGSERTGLLWVDDVYMGEVSTPVNDLLARGIEPPIQTVTAFPNDGTSMPATACPAGAVQFTYGTDTLYFSFMGAVPAGGSVELYLATHDELAYDNETVASFFRITAPDEGPVRLERAFERIDRAFAIRDAVFYLNDPRSSRIVRTVESGGNPRLDLSIPYSVLDAAPKPGDVWRFNVVRSSGGTASAFASGPLTRRRFARLAFDRLPALAVTPVRFGTRPAVTLQQNPWVTITDTYWGDNTLDLNLTNRATVDREVIVRLTGTGITKTEGRFSVPAGQTASVQIPYRAAKDGLGVMGLEIEDATGARLTEEHYPFCIPPAIEFRPGRRFLYPAEETLDVQGEVFMRGPDAPASLALILVDLRSGSTVRRLDVPVSGNAFAAHVNVTDLRINEDPIADYALVAQAPGGVEARLLFGRLRKPVFDPLPPIDRVDVDNDGMLLVNGQRFFAIVSSLNVKDLRKGHAESSAMGCNVSKHNFSPPYSDVRDVFDYTWSLNTYEAPCLSGHPVEKAEQGLFPIARQHPAFLVTVAAEVYRAPTPLEHYDRCAAAGQRPVLYEYYNCGCWFDTVMGQRQGGDIAMFPVVVQKAPLTRLVSRNLYRERAAAQRPRCLFISIPIAISRDSSLDLIRCVVYLGVVNGANGMYLYMTDYPGANGEQVAMMRGVVLELRRMSDVFVAPPVAQTMVAYPENAGIEMSEREYKGKRYLIAVNPTRTEKKVRFVSEVLSPGKSVRVRFELPRDLPIRDGAFSDSFSPCSVHVYEIF